jgi:hypothetical protein
MRQKALNVRVYFLTLMIADGIYLLESIIEATLLAYYTIDGHLVTSNKLIARRFF